MNTKYQRPPIPSILHGLFAFFLMLLSSAMPLFAQAPGELDTAFDTGSSLNAVPSPSVFAALPAGGGKVYIGGRFTSVRGALRNNIARLNADGTADTSFDPGTGVDNFVQCMAVQTDGKLLIGGDFPSYNGTTRGRIARLNTDGSLDTSFIPPLADGSVRSIAIQADGKVIIGGAFTIYDDTWRNNIARLNADGSLDTTFNVGSGANAFVLSVTMQADGKVLIGGNFTTYNDVVRNRIARLNTNGSLDTSFNPGTGANNYITSSALQADGKLLIGGHFTTYGVTSRAGIARLNTNGTLDTSFISAIAVIGISSFSLQADGKVFIGNARLNANGSLDTSFNSGIGANSTISAVAVQADGKFIIGGSFTYYNGLPRKGIVRVNANGSLDTGFNPGTGSSEVIKAVTAQADGKVIIFGSLNYYNDTERRGIARVNTDGGLDTTFIPSTIPNETISCAATLPDGKLIICSSRPNRIKRLNMDGSLDTSFNPGSGPSDNFFAVAVQTDGKLLIVGNFTSYNGTVRNRIARLNADGSLDTSFNPGSGANARVLSIRLQADGKIIIGGGFTTYNDTARRCIARLNADGSVDTSFNPGTGANNTVSSVAIQSDGKVLIGGDFTSYDGTTRRRIARLNADGSLDTTFNFGSGANEWVGSVIMQADGKLLMGGNFTSYNGTVRNRIARLNTDGSLDTSFNPGTGAAGTVSYISLQADGKALISGQLLGYNGTARSYMARIHNGPASQILGATSTSRIEWLRGGSTPEVEQVSFESSVDGVAWTAIGSGTRMSGGWELDRLDLRSSGYLRARGHVNHGSGSSVIEQVVSYALDSSPPVTIADANLKAALRTALSKPTGAITEADMLTLTRLNLAGLGLTNISGLEKATNLRILDLRRNSFANAAALWTVLDQITPMYCLYIDVRRPVADPAGLITQTVTDTNGGTFFITIDAPNLPTFDISGLGIDTTNQANLAALQVFTAAGVAVETGGINLPPVASATASILNVATRTVSLNGSVSRDIDGTIASWAWSWSGGNATGANPTVTLPDGGTTVTLTVTDDDGATSSTTVTVNLVTLASAMQASGLTGVNAQPNATPHNDGVENLLKYAFNMNLSGPDSRTLVSGTGNSGLPAIGLTGTASSTIMRVEFLRRKGSGLVYTPMRSSTLAPGSFVAMSGTPVVTSIDDNWERVVVQESANPSTLPKSFAMVEVRLP